MLAFALVDVFADAPLSGNPLAVVDGGEALADDVLARVAREFNQSETTFVLPSSERGATRRLRSFTAGGAEVTGAGHNSLGAWWWLVATGRERAGALSQELGADVLDVDVAVRDGRVVVRLRQAPAVLGPIADMGADLARALGLDGDLARETTPVVSTGAPHLLVEAGDPAAVDSARPEAPALAALLARAGAQGCYLFARTERGGADAYARFFNPTVGLWEDPATGSAAGPLAWWLADQRPGQRSFAIAQGHAMGRPSRIEVEVEGDEVTLLGSAVLVAEGRLELGG